MVLLKKKPEQTYYMVLEKKQPQHTPDEVVNN